MKAYKLFRTKNGKLYPLYVYANEEISMGIWLEAKEGERTARGKVKSKLGELAYRPGYHLTEVPLASHIGTKQDDGTLAQAKDTVWCEVEFADNIDYTPIAAERGRNKKGKIIQRNACLDYLPTNGFYWYTTNSNAECRWLISGAIKVNRILSQNEVNEICLSSGFKPQKLAS